ncbi:hypothetical protein [Streptomyces rhizosphaerihabitans]|uniref:hypothetical protein n=1 Tax=Streptomyces rhizosphaerihabitans TaxID=1266770 RepID=UPI0021C21673|nr:hypothetical protein [Streptomyces rhizosphaerihabitans]MCT9009401.1 hypothetical protein [Streptomyces rhizosphaerihabitans]
MKVPEILSRFDGRGHTEFLLGGFEAGDSDTITAIGFEFGYDLQATGTPSKSAIRLVFVRNDSPTARQRAQRTQDRLCAGGPLLPTWNAPSPGAQPGTTRPVTAVEMASARRGLIAYEAHGARGFALLVGLLGLGSLIVAGVLRDRPGAAFAVLLVFAIPFTVTAAFIPRWMKRWYEKNRRLVDLYDQQRTGWVEPPPPPPGPSGRGPGTGNGFNARGRNSTE